MSLQIATPAKHAATPTRKLSPRRRLHTFAVIRLPPLSTFLCHAIPLRLWTASRVQVSQGQVSPVTLWAMTRTGCCQLGEQDFFRAPSGIHAGHVAKPGQPVDAQQVYHLLLHAKTLGQLCCTELVFPLLAASYTQDGADTIAVKSVEPSQMRGLDSPRLCTVE